MNSILKMLFLAAMATAICACIDGRGSDTIDQTVIDARIAEIEAQGGIAAWILPGESLLLKMEDVTSPVFGTELFLPGDALDPAEPGAVAYIRPSNRAKEQYEDDRFFPAGPFVVVQVENPQSRQSLMLVTEATVTVPIHRGAEQHELHPEQDQYAVLLQYNGTQSFPLTPEKIESGVLSGKTNWFSEFVAAITADAPRTMPQWQADFSPINKCTFQSIAFVAVDKSPLFQEVGISSDDSGLLHYFFYNASASDSSQDALVELVTLAEQDVLGRTNSVQRFNSFRSLIRKTNYDYSFETILQSAKALNFNNEETGSSSYVYENSMVLISVDRDGDFSADEIARYFLNSTGAVTSMASSGVTSTGLWLSGSVTTFDRSLDIKLTAAGDLDMVSSSEKEFSGHTVCYSFSYTAAGEVDKISAVVDSNGDNQCDSGDFQSTTFDLATSGCDTADLQMYFAEQIEEHILGLGDLFPRPSQIQAE